MDNVWVTQDKRRIPVRLVEFEHLKNALALCEERIGELRNVVALAEIQIGGYKGERLKELRRLLAVIYRNLRRWRDKHAMLMAEMNKREASRKPMIPKPDRHINCRCAVTEMSNGALGEIVADVSVKVLKSVDRVRIHISNDTEAYSS